MKTFSSTSEEPYDRHHYKVHHKQGVGITVESYDEARYIWQTNIGKLSHIEVVDVGCSNKQEE